MFGVKRSEDLYESKMTNWNLWNKKMPHFFAMYLFIVTVKGNAKKKQSRCCLIYCLESHFQDSRARSSFAFVWWWWSSSVWRRGSVAIITAPWSRSRSVSATITRSVAITWSTTTFAAIATFASNVDSWCWAMCSFGDRIINSNSKVKNK